MKKFITTIGILFILIGCSSGVKAEQQSSKVVNNSEKKCSAIQSRKDCWQEEVNRCIWSRNSCKTNPILLPNNTTLAAKDDKCSKYKSNSLCTTKKTTLCRWTKKLRKCVWNVVDDGKSLNLPNKKKAFDPFAD